MQSCFLIIDFRWMCLNLVNYLRKGPPHLFLCFKCFVLDYGVLTSTGTTACSLFSCWLLLKPPLCSRYIKCWFFCQANELFVSHVWQAHGIFGFFCRLRNSHKMVNILDSRSSVQAQALARQFVLTVPLSIFMYKFVLVNLMQWDNPVGGLVSHLEGNENTSCLWNWRWAPAW